MNVAVIKGVVLCLPVFGSVIGIRAFELLVKKLCRLGVISALAVTLLINFKSAVIVIADSHHQRQMLCNIFHAA
mgnify:CR=1 FL=1